MENSLTLFSGTEYQISENYTDAKSSFDEIIWKQLGKITVAQALEKWLHTLGPHTQVNYRSAFRKLSDFDLIELSLSLQQFSLINHESVVDDIKLLTQWRESTRQARAAAYISFTSFLQRRTKGIIHKAVPNREGVNKTFFNVRDKVKTDALSQNETRLFLSTIEKINPRDALIAKLILQGGKRKAEVLNLRVDQIDFDRDRIRFIQTKTRGIRKETVVNYPAHVMEELHQYTSGRQGYVFITRNGKKISPTQIDRNFLKAGNAAGINTRITPHVLRVTLVTRLKELRIQDSDIMKITGHASPTQLASYDKSDMGENASLYHHFV